MGEHLGEQPAPGICPACDARLTLATDMVVGELLECDDCGVELEVVGLGPLVLKVNEEEVDE